MQPKNLAGMVRRLVETGESQQLNQEQLREFHAEYRREVAPTIDEHRECQRRAYEDSRDITLN